MDGWGLDKPAEHTGRRQFVYVCRRAVGNSIWGGG